MNFDTLPQEIWLQVFKYLDLKSQNVVRLVCKDFVNLVSSVWKARLLRLRPTFNHITEDFRVVKLNIVMKALVEDRFNDCDSYGSSHLFEILWKHKILSENSVLDQNQSYDFFHDYRAGS